MRRGHHVGPSRVNLGMDRECGHIDRVFTVHHLSPVIHFHQVGRPDLAEVHSKRIDPEMIRPLGIPRGDVPGHALVISELSEQSKEAASMRLRCWRSSVAVVNCGRRGNA